MSSKPKSNHQWNEPSHCLHSTNSLVSCLVDGDAAQQNRNRRSRRRSLLLSVTAQLGILTAVILVPILSKTNHIAFASVMPMPPYRPLSARGGNNHHAAISHPQPHIFSFCLDCRPARPSVQTTPTGLIDDREGLAVMDPGPATSDCAECGSLLPSTHAQPVIPHQSSPKIIHIATLDPAMLLHRVEPIFPTLPRQMGREGRVELHAIIGADGSVRSLQFVGGDELFYPSARDAVTQWRYKPTFLNGVPVEVDTRITVIYKLNR